MDSDENQVDMVVVLACPTCGNRSCSATVLDFIDADRKIRRKPKGVKVKKDKPPTRSNVIGSADEEAAKLQRRDKNARRRQHQQLMKQKAKKEAEVALQKKAEKKKVKAEGRKMIEEIKKELKEDADWEQWKMRTWPGPELHGDREKSVRKKWKALYDMCTSEAAAVASSEN
jgi:molecular chaperone DnaK (HSP70)